MEKITINSAEDLKLELSRNPTLLRNINTAIFEMSNLFRINGMVGGANYILSNINEDLFIVKISEELISTIISLFGDKYIELVSGFDNDFDYDLIPTFESDQFGFHDNKKGYYISNKTFAKLSKDNKTKLNLDLEINDYEDRKQRCIDDLLNYFNNIKIFDMYVRRILEDKFSTIQLINAKLNVLKEYKKSGTHLNMSYNYIRWYGFINKFNDVIDRNIRLVTNKDCRIILYEIVGTEHKYQVTDISKGIRFYGFDNREYFFDKGNSYKGEIGLYNYSESLGANIALEIIEQNSVALKSFHEYIS